MAEDVLGLQALLKSMDSLPLTMQKTLIVRSLRKGAEPIQKRMEQLAPDDPDTPGSRLANIGIAVRDQTATGARAVIGPATESGMRVTEAALAAEFGTAHQSATPFVRPAFDEKRDEALKLVGEILAEGIEKELAKR